MAELMLELACRDAAVFSALVPMADIHDSALGFHAQQVVEKAVKSVMFRRRVLVPRTHSINLLLDQLFDAGIAAPAHADKLDTLNSFAVQARYGALDVGPLDRATVVQWLDDVLAWAADPARH